MEKYRLRQKNYPGSRPSQSERCALISDDAYWYRVILDEAQCIKNVRIAIAWPLPTLGYMPHDICLGFEPISPKFESFS